MLTHQFTGASVSMASELAERAHRGQMDRDGKPHFDHCERVAKRVADDGGVTEHVVVAYLHDVLEDTNVQYGEIEQGFGVLVADAVAALTHLDECESYKQYIVKAGSNAIARAVKIADIHDNLGRLHDAKSLKRQDMYLWALEYLTHSHA